MKVALRSELSALALALSIFTLCDAALFATPLYRSVLDPASTAGSFERALETTDRRATSPSTDVLVLGDSRIYNGLDERTADRAARGLRFLNAAVPGTTPRCWTVFDRALDPAARRFRAIVVPVDTYNDDDSAIGSVDGDNRPFDLRYIVFHTSWPQSARIAASFSTLDAQSEAFADLVLRGPLVREDLQAFVADPRARFAALAGEPASELADAPSAHLRVGSMQGLSADFSRGTLVAPAGYPASALAELHRQVLLVPSASASYARYRREWLGPIVARYLANATPVIFVRIPTRPLHRALTTVDGATLLAFQTSGARLVPPAPYLALERPELFADADHLNADGAQLFSAQLGRDVARALSDPSFGAAPAKTVAPSAQPAAPAAAESAAPEAATMRHRLGALARALGIGIPMRFQSYEFALFFGAIVALFYALPNMRARRVLLLIASWYFYARWNAWYVAILLALTVTDYFFAIGIARSSGLHRRALLVAGIAANLAFLGTAKYADFFSGSLAALLRLPSDPWALHVLVPVGISFHTFQSISYVVDVSRGKMRAVRDPLDYALYIAFFPQLLAGPIVRAGRFFGELWNWRVPAAPVLARGLGEIALGLFKKGALADHFAPVADNYFGAIGAHPGAPAAWGGALAFALQIYFDFSGYSDIAIGCARVLGFDFPENFRRPYLSWSITEFWRRWHMTLSAWLRDYLYIPLGGNQHGRAATYRNLMITMLLGGLWHGANWTFVAWGAYHGMLLCIERGLGIRRSREGPAPAGLRRAAATALTFLLVLFGWVIFRAQTFADAATVLRAMLTGGPGPALLEAPLLWLAALALAVEIGVERGWAKHLPETPVLLRGAAAAALLLGLELATYPGAAAQFVYFKF